MKCEICNKNNDHLYTLNDMNICQNCYNTHTHYKIIGYCQQCKRVTSQTTRHDNMRGINLLYCDKCGDIIELIEPNK